MRLLLVVDGDHLEVPNESLSKSSKIHLPGSIDVLGAGGTSVVVVVQSAFVSYLAG